MRHAHVDVTGVGEPVRAGDVAGGAVRDNRDVRVVAGIVHAERREQVLLHELGIAAAGQLLDQRAQHDVTGVAIAHFFPGFEVERPVAHHPDDLVERRRRHLHLSIGRQRREVRDAARVGQQVPHGNAIPRGRKIRYVGLHPLVHFQRVTFFEQQNRGGGELLGNRSEPELGRWRIGDVPFEVREPIPFAEQNVGSLGDQHGAHESLFRDRFLDDLLHPGNVLGRRGRRQRQNQ